MGLGIAPPLSLGSLSASKIVWPASLEADTMLRLEAFDANIAIGVDGLHADSWLDTGNCAGFRDGGSPTHLFKTAGGVGNGPLVVANQCNGKPALRFNNNSARILSTTLTTGAALLGSTDEYVFWAVLKNNSPGTVGAGYYSAQMLAADGSSGTQKWELFLTLTQAGIGVATATGYAPSNAEARASITAATLSLVRLSQSVVAGPALQLATKVGTGGTPVTSAGQTQLIVNSQGLTIGPNNDFAQMPVIDLFALYGVRRSVSGPEDAGVNAYLNHTWGPGL